MQSIYVKKGTETVFDSGFRTGCLQLSRAHGVRLRVQKARAGLIELVPGRCYPLSEIHGAHLLVSSETEGIGKFQLSNSLEQESLATRKYLIPSFPLVLDCDADRDGKVGENELGKKGWSWGGEGHGAIILFDNDGCLFDGPGKRSELAEVIVRPTGLSDLPECLQLRLYATRSAAKRFSVYRRQDRGFQKILGPNVKPSQIVNISQPLCPQGETLYVAAHDYPDDEFEGLITLELHLRQLRKGVAEGVLLQSDKIVFRVAPWLVLPTTCRPVSVYICEFENQVADNSRLIAELKKNLSNLKHPVPLEIIPLNMNKGDRWIQDEIEFGWSQGVSHGMHAVFDSPRDRPQGLRDFARQLLRGDDVGHFELEGSSSSLDSFGNLEVSPPMSVNGKDYPFGRIVFGGRGYSDFTNEARAIMPKLRKFLYAQRLQSPIEVFTDWLKVGHVDEIVSFVPYPNDKKFKVLIGSPAAAYAILLKLKAEGYGETLLFNGKKRLVRTSPENFTAVPADTPIATLLDKEEFWEINLNVYQEYMNLNRAILQRDLGLSADDIVDVPALFKVVHDESGALTRTSAYFPAMVNHLVLDNLSIVPKPYGPVKDGKPEGKCEFERAFEEAVPKREVFFIDEWDPYFLGGGDMHCATNVKRVPDVPLEWWKTVPDDAFDV